ncbi:restriction endonuclease [Streptomyces sp. NBC_01538]|uniref:restriction endonuclease n=1 Tax=Streptomyces sp. NBC_01538 TaxID=2903897 RepID=UPI0038660381
MIWINDSLKNRLITTSHRPSAVGRDPLSHRRPVRRTGRRPPVRRSRRQDEGVALLWAAVIGVAVVVTRRAVATRALVDPRPHSTDRRRRRRPLAPAETAASRVGEGARPGSTAADRPARRTGPQGLRVRRTGPDAQGRLPGRATRRRRRQRLRRPGRRPAGRVWAVQCKHRRDGQRGAAVGVGVLQQVNGTARQIHGADIAVVLTNGRFTSKAIPWGKEHGIHLVDRSTLGEWAAGSRPLWDLLDRIPPPRWPTALS